MKRVYLLLLAAGIAAAPLALVSCRQGPTNGESAGLSPQFIPWVWQRHEDLSFLTPGTTAAVWIATVEISESVTPHLRENPVVLPAQSPVIAVIRLESPGDTLPPIDQLAGTLISLFQPVGAVELQVDFDAATSQRRYYKDLLSALKTGLPDTPLSITALASWCMGDSWVDDLPVDYAVPMLYRMGHDAARINQDLAAGGHFSAKVCRQHAGYSTDEERVPIPGMDRIFLFNDRPWTKSTYESITEELLAATEHPPDRGR